MIGIIDTGAKNIGSILNSLNYLKIKNKIIQNPKDISKKITHIILPGVGNFESVMGYLKKNNFTKEKLIKIINEKKILAICVGFQILFTSSDEAKFKGIGYFDGKIKDLKKTKCKGSIPHVGFNSVNILVKKELDFIKEKDFYFVHSYVLLDDNLEKHKKYIIGNTTHGKIKFISMIISSNIIATQFHPEKSGVNGIKLFEYFYGKKKSYI